MSILTAVCLVAFGFGIGSAVGATAQRSADKKDCNACWNDMYSRAWTLTLDGEQYKMFPLWEPGKGKTK